jgi:hypothetical protein
MLFADAPTRRTPPRLIPTFDLELYGLISIARHANPGFFHSLSLSLSLPRFNIDRARARAPTSSSRRGRVGKVGVGGGKNRPEAFAVALNGEEVVINYVLDPLPANNRKVIVRPWARRANASKVTPLTPTAV